MREYIAKVKKCIRDLKSVGEQVSTSRSLEHLIMGLDDKYDVLKAHLNIKTDLTEAECTTAMLAEESRQNTYGIPDTITQTQRVAIPPESSNQHRSRCRSRHRSRSRSRSYDRRSTRERKNYSSRERQRRSSRERGNGRSGANEDKRREIRCYHCKRRGHIAMKCWDLHPELNPRRQVILQQQQFPYIHPQRQQHM